MEKFGTLVGTSIRDRVVDHRHTMDEERRIREAALDRSLAESFPASDPLSTNPNPDDDTLMEAVAGGDATPG